MSLVLHVDLLTACPIPSNFTVGVYPIPSPLLSATLTGHNRPDIRVDENEEQYPEHERHCPW